MSLSSTDSAVDFRNHISAANVSIRDNDCECTHALHSYNVRNATYVPYTALYSNADASFGVQFDSYVFEENAGAASVCVVFLDGCIERDVNIGYTTFDGTAKST